MKIRDIKQCFRSYYSSQDFLDNLLLPPKSTFHHYRVELFSFGRRKVFRRIAEVFRTKHQLRKTLTRLSPKNVYYTPTQWLDPVNIRRKKDKEIEDILLSCPLYFDIDFKFLSEKSLKGSIKTTKNLVDFIERNYSKRPDLIVFSGKQGFHVYYWDWSDIVFTEIKPKDRIEVFVKTRKRILDLLKQEGIRVDSSVTIDPWRLLRLPGTLHGDTGLVALKIDNLNDFDPTKKATFFPLKIYEEVIGISLKGLLLQNSSL